MRIDIVARAGAEHQQKTAAQFASGVARHGVRARIVAWPHDVQAETAVCWGWRIGRDLAGAERRVLVMERGYIGDRFRWTSFGWNGLNGRAAFAAIDDGGARFERHFAHLVRPWREGQGYALIAGQVSGDQSIAGVDIEAWYAKAARAAEALGLEPVYRNHPIQIQRGREIRLPGVRTLDGTLERALAGAAMVMTWNSNSGVDAALAGVPVVACDKGSMARPVAAHGLTDRPGMPDRSQWLSRMAWTQWRDDEIESGAAWDALNGECRPWN